MDTAEHLRHFDPDCPLVFTTTSPGHALEVFRVRALHYLVKPYQEAELAALFDEIVKRFPITDRYIEINTTGSLVRLRFQNILYAEDFDSTDFILKNGKRIPISRDLAKAARTAFDDYLFKNFKNFGRRN